VDLKRKYSMESPPDFGAEPRLIDASEWRLQRWGWLESVRRDGSINPMARLVAHALALDFANADTSRCDPKYSDLADALSTSEDSISRSIKALKAASWIVILSGRGRGNHTEYGFLTRAKIVALKGGKSAGIKGGRNAGFSGSEKGADLRIKGGKSAGSYIKDKPYKNHKGRTVAPRVADNPLVIRDAERAVSSFRGGRSDALSDLKPWIISHIIAANLLTPGELQQAGLAENGD
jgi:helix-turn-helix protein